MSCVDGKAPTLHGIPIAVSGSGHIRKQISAFEAAIHMQESTHKVPKSASQAILSRMQPSCDLPITSRRFALGARDVCLVGENLTCSVLVLWGCEGLWSYDYGYS